MNEMKRLELALTARLERHREIGTNMNLSDSTRRDAIAKYNEILHVKSMIRDIKNGEVAL